MAKCRSISTCYYTARRPECQMQTALPRWAKSKAALITGRLFWLGVRGRLETEGSRSVLRHSNRVRNCITDQLTRQAGLRRAVLQKQPQLQNLLRIRRTISLVRWSDWLGSLLCLLLFLQARYTEIVHKGVMPHTIYQCCYDRTQVNRRRRLCHGARLDAILDFL